MHDARLIGPGVATLTVNRTKTGLWIKVVHEGTGAIVNRFSTQEGVVRIQHAVNEAQYLPVSNQLGKPLADPVQQHRRGRSGREFFAP